MSTDRELLPCPFCGDTAHPHAEPDEDWPDKCFVFYRCRGCRAQAGNVYGSRDPSEWQDARAHWNRRVAAGNVLRTDPTQPWTPEHCRNYPTEAALVIAELQAAIVRAAASMAPPATTGPGEGA